MSNFDKYKRKGDIHWQEAFSRSIFKFNAYLRARYDIALKFLGDIKEKTILDMGAGDCAFSFLLAKKGAKIIAVDSSKEGLEYGKRNFEKKKFEGKFLESDVSKTGLQDSSVDMAISLDVIEHLEDQESLVGEASRVLKPGGVFVVSTPYRLSEKPAPYHIKEFYPEELKNLLEKYFTDIEIIESHHILWTSLYSYRGPIIHLPWAKYLINILALWFRKNIFLEDSSSGGDKDKYTQIICRAIKK